MLPGYLQGWAGHISSHADWATGSHIFGRHGQVILGCLVLEHAGGSHSRMLGCLSSCSGILSWDLQRWDGQID